MFSLTQLDVPGHRRQWMLMDMVNLLASSLSIALLR
jgi:hypothetical protein